jgi:hypothetical protein
MKRILRGCLKVSAHPYEGLPLVLACGVGRSGTTALRHGLSAHPDVHSTGNENNIVYDVLATARHNCTFPSRKATMHVARPAYDRQFRLLLLNLLWPEPRRGRRRPQALLASCDLTAERADYFVRAFPGGRMVYIVRNGIAVVASRMTHPNFEPDGFEAHCRRWRAARDMAEWGEGRDDFLLVRQEDFLAVETAEAAVREMLGFMRLRECRACVEVLTKRRFHPTEAKGEGEAAGQDLEKRKERWRLWTEEQREMFREICGPAMEYFGYEMP